MTMMKRRPGSSHPQAFALVVTLIMLVLAAGIAVGLLVNASIDRGTSRSTFDRYQAELAVQNGLEAAKKALMASPAAGSAVTADDTFLVTRIDGPVMPLTPAPAAGPTPSYYYLAKAQAGSASKMDYYPLFSGGASVTNQTIDLTAGATRAVATPTPPPNPTTTDLKAAIQIDSGKTKILKTYPELSPWLGAVSTQWIEVVDPNETGTGGTHKLPYQRYSFWVEDLGGYVDASVAGNTDDTGNANKRPRDQSNAAKRYLTTPAEVALFTLFDPAPTTDSGKTGADLLIGKRDMQLTTTTLKELAPALATPDILSPNVAVRLISDSEQALVPFGYGYKDEGSQTAYKLQINDQVKTGGAAAVQAIAQKINANLPNFGPVRNGKLTTTGLDYVNSLAASIIDYADTDSDATVDPAPNPTYRGIDSYPFINEIYVMKWWKSTYQKSGTWWVDIQMDTWAEVWNPSNQTIPSGSATIDIIENHTIQAGSYSYTFGTTANDLPGGSSVTSSPTGPATISVPTMQPNEYTAYKVRTDLFHFNTGVAPPLIFPAAGTTSMPLSASLLSNYTMKWNNNLVDRAGSNTQQHIQRASGSLRGPPNYIVSNKNWRGSYPGFDYTINPGNQTADYYTMGDPRSAFSIGSAQVPIAYDLGSSFWVRNNRSNVPATQIYSAQRPSAWPDSGHDTATVSTYPGSGAPASVQDPPTTRPASAVTEPSKAPATISNTGAYSSMAELGNIYDPGLWNIPPDTSAPPRWSDITKSDITAASQASANYGGGMTLHIGRPEFTLFDKPGTRAWQLLDLLHTDARITTKGLVNINTASREALRALGANVILDRDPKKLPAGTLYPPYTSKQADQFADAVIAARPFLSPAQLSGMKIAGGTRAFFGNSAAWSAPTQPAPTEWNDSGNEEYFAKVYPLAAVRSRNFRIFVTGQALDKSNNVLSTSSKVFQVYLKPARDAAGKVTSQTVVNTYEAQLPL